MSKIDSATVEKLASLSRLSLSQAESVTLQKDLSLVVGWMAQLKEVDTDGVEPLYHMTERTNAIRKDLPQNTVSREKALENAPKTDGEFFLVPKVK